MLSRFVTGGHVAEFLDQQFVTTQFSDRRLCGVVRYDKAPNQKRFTFSVHISQQKSDLRSEPSAALRKIATMNLKSPHASTPLSKAFILVCCLLLDKGYPTQSGWLQCKISARLMTALGHSRQTQAPGASPDVRYASDSDQICASQRTDAKGRLCCKSILSISSRHIDSRSGTNAHQRFKRASLRIRLLQSSISQSPLGDFCNTIGHEQTSAALTRSSALGGHLEVDVCLRDLAGLGMPPATISTICSAANLFPAWLT
jgi:hypothetical protein